MKITLQFSTTAGPIAAIVRFVTWSEFSHCDFVLPDGTLLGSQWKEKDGNGVQIRQPNYEKFSRTERYTVDVPIVKYTNIMAWAKSQVGKPYDSTAIFGILAHRDWKEDDSWFCSEFVAAAFEQAGLHLVNEKLNRITPQTLIQSPYLQKVQ